MWAAPGRDRAYPAPVLRPARRRARGADHPRVGRYGGLDRRRGRRTLPERGALRRPVSCRRVGHRSRSTRSAAGPGTTPARWPAPSRSGAGTTPRRRPAPTRTDRARVTRYALWKNPDDLTDRQHDKLAWIAKTDPRLHRAYLLKEGLRYVFAVKGEAGTGPGPVAVMGASAAASRSSSTSAADPPTPSAITPRSTHEPVQRPDRVDQHQDPTTHPHGVRLPLRRRPDRPRHARPRRDPSTPARPRHHLNPLHATATRCRRPVHGWAQPCFCSPP